MKFEELIRANFTGSAEAINVAYENCAEKLGDAIEASIGIYENHGTIFFAGNGGSAADACHIASELVGAFEDIQAPLPALSFATDVAILTSVSNDYSFTNIFTQQAKALMKKGDQLWVISTSGNSPNILDTARWAKSEGINTVGLLGRDGGKVAESVDIAIIVPSENTQRIQEVQILILHTLASALKRKFPDGLK
ncbi:MAG TPA: SIS domain-containing protein [bacterium]|jgi:D-sedoheptulose 7-phosphate isomerase